VGASKVIVCGRNAQLQQAFVESVEESVRDRIDASHTIDLADLASVREFAKYVDQKYTTIDVLICNAGVMVRTYGCRSSFHLGFRFVGTE
jgi:short-subunit dehydrogenase involved in D-alanine esterification of teichoic acids